MLELELVLDFACCSCGETMAVTVKCAGQGMAGGKNGVASVKIPCPNCQGINQAVFAPDDGTIHHVLAADKPRFIIPEPSLN